MHADDSRRRRRRLVPGGMRIKVQDVSYGRGLVVRCAYGACSDQIRCNIEPSKLQAGMLRSQVNTPRAALPCPAATRRPHMHHFR